MMGAEMITHFDGSPFWKFASFACPVNVLNRRYELLALKPD